MSLPCNTGTVRLSECVSWFCEHKTRRTTKDPKSSLGSLVGIQFSVVALSLILALSAQISEDSETG